jgi:hypothetical protein
MIDNAIASLIGTTGSVARVMPSTAVAGVADLPRYVYTALGGPRDLTDNGVAGIVTSLYQVDAYAVTATAAREMLRKIMRDANAAEAGERGMQNYRGTVDDTKIELIHFTDTPRFGPIAMKSEGSNQTTPRLIVSMSVKHRET